MTRKTIFYPRLRVTEANVNRRAINLMPTAHIFKVSFDDWSVKLSHTSIHGTLCDSIEQELSSLRLEKSLK